ncbi:MAG: UbiA family prenyltransferase [Planctomycetes bacterium]|nr:UbiA family prenyltransferase [Planctomycetota bacterium]
MAGAAGRIGIFLEMIKFQHTVFAMPFAVLSALLACSTNGRLLVPAWPWIILCVVAARTAAMGFNRIADAALDAGNPRTSGRAIPAGILVRKDVWLLVAGSAAVFIFSAAMLNSLCLYLSPVVLAVLLGYSYAKRFTVLCHAWLGLSLALAPLGAWVAILGRVDLPPALLGGAVVFWVAGFDIIYACQDVAFDREAGLCSIPAKIGIPRALWVSAAMHAAAVLLLALLAVYSPLGGIYCIGLGLAAAAILYEHLIVKPRDLSRVNAAFFAANGFVSVGLMTAGALDLLL